MTRSGLLVLWLIPLALIANVPRAVAQADGIRQYKHNSWTHEAGAPSKITSIAQSPDGYLWLAAQEGLYRFDGVTFERMRHADPDKDSLPASRVIVTRSGTIWATFGRTLFQYRQGKLYAVPGPAIEAFSPLREGPDGAIWFSDLKLGGGGLYRYWRGRFEQVGGKWGIPKAYVSSILIARNGAVWTVTPGKLMFLRPGSRRFHVMDEDVGFYGGLAEDAQGNIWFSGREGTRLVRDAMSPMAKPARAIAYPPVARLRGASPMVDRMGALWGSSWSNGIFRIPLGGAAPAGSAIDTFEAKDGLSSDVNEQMLEDREGNIWVGTQLGLDSFRATPVTIEPAIELNPEGYMLTSDGRGTVYVVASDKIYEIAPGKQPRLAAQWPEPIDAVCPSHDGSIWVSSDSHLGRLQHGSIRSVGGPGVTMSSWACREDRQGRTWFLTQDGGVRGRLRDGRWVAPSKAVADYSPFLDMALNHEGYPVVKWGTKNVRVIGARTISSIRQQALGTGRIFDIADAPTGLFIAGDERLGRWRGDQVQTLDTRKTYPWLKIRGLVQTPHGETWAIGANGILRLSTAKLDYAFGHPGADLPYERFDANDGLKAGMQHAGYRGQQVAQGGDGRIWFLTASGVARVDPANLRRNAVAPPVTVRSLSAGGQTYVDPVSITLPSGTTIFAIGYTAPSLSVPSRVRFRYQLEGVDKAWVDPGARREAFYTNLGPGRYRFRVIASNNDGIWNQTGATLDVEIRPAFYQTWWFLLLCLLPGIAVARLLYTMRLRQVAGRVRHQMETRIAERERIARELHDTLLQSFQGVTMFFQSVVDRFPAGSPLRSSIEEGLNYADAALAEGRERVLELRSAAAGQDFAEALQRRATAIMTGATPRLSVRVEGTPRPLFDLVSDELLRVMQEAVRNALQHAGAKTIQITLDYGAWKLALVVRDDGVGIPHSILDGGSPTGHYGIMGMRERAARIGGRLVLGRRADNGTEIVMTVPARSAYRDGRMEILRWLQPREWRGMWRAVRKGVAKGTAPTVDPRFR
ncbi:sensor histidine kinase [Sphingomonas sp. M1-B02]|uniref:sensor histidine kinase n=1 Tax=Sphingomonas sp. M1-B02 TaxID=3114300 RepID=UPI00224099FD|nr:sensor histidine kinase [Sphingomonas sp. S6-11]UZK66321.1 triple tyrosine motif-containing protein [Sphingomonas sp. S6-11]